VGKIAGIKKNSEKRSIGFDSKNVTVGVGKAFGNINTQIIINSD